MRCLEMGRVPSDACQAILILSTLVFDSKSVRFLLLAVRFGVGAFECLRQ